MTDTFTGVRLKNCRSTVIIFIKIRLIDILATIILLLGLNNAMSKNKNRVSIIFQVILLILIFVLTYYESST